MLGVYFEPQYLRAKQILTKVYILDDIYDAYGTPGELKLFTKAIERFATCTLPTLIVYNICIYIYLNQGSLFYFQVGY